MDPERDRLKHLLVILLEALAGSGGEGPPSHRRIQDRISAAGLDEQDVMGLLDWIEASWHPDSGISWNRDPLPDAPSADAFRFFGDTDREYLSAAAMGYLIRLVNSRQINGAQLEALLQYSSLVAIRPLEQHDLEPVIEQVLFRTRQPGLTGGAAEGFESLH